MEVVWFSILFSSFKSLDLYHWGVICPLKVFGKRKSDLENGCVGIVRTRERKVSLQETRVLLPFLSESGVRGLGKNHASVPVFDRLSGRSESFKIK